MAFKAIPNAAPLKYHAEDIIYNVYCLMEREATQFNWVNNSYFSPDTILQRAYEATGVQIDRIKHIVDLKRQPNANPIPRKNRRRTRYKDKAYKKSNLKREIYRLKNEIKNGIQYHWNGTNYIQCDGNETKNDQCDSNFTQVSVKTQTGEPDIKPAVVVKQEPLQIGIQENEDCCFEPNKRIKVEIKEECSD